MLSGLDQVLVSVGAVTVAVTTAVPTLPLPQWPSPYLATLVNIC